MGSDRPGRFLVERMDVFTKVLLPGGMKRKKLTKSEKAMYQAPHPTPESRVPVHVLPGEIGRLRAADRGRAGAPPACLVAGADRVGRPRSGLPRIAEASLGTHFSQSPNR